MPSKLDEFANRYAQAWCSQNPEGVASFYAEGASLSVNDTPQLWAEQPSQR